MTLNRWIPELFERILNPAGGVKSALFPAKRPKRRRRESDRVAAIVQTLEDRTLLAAPVFLPSVYGFNVDETVPVGTVVGAVSATDADGQSVSYSLDDGVGGFAPFAIDGNGQITTTSDFDYEIVASYSLTAVATDPDGNTGVASVGIGINDIDEIPVFSEQFYSFSVDENVPVGTIVGTVSASSPLGRALTYWLDDDSVGLGGPFEIDQDTGAITTTRALDYETTQYYSLSISADDEQFSEASTSVSITIGDIDENPTLAPSYYSYTIDENTPVGTVVGTLMGNDPQSDPLTYYLNDGAYNALFAVDELTGDITLVHPLDYESQSYYSMTGYAEDPDGNSGSALVEVTVNDVADDPIFDEPSYTFSMNEYDPTGTLIGTVTATDPQALAITYSLEQTDGNASFAIDPLTGDITVDVPMEYRQDPTLNLTAYATNSAGIVTSMPVTVDVIDFDETPNGNAAPALSGVTFTITEYNYGFATGDLTAAITDDHVLDNGLFELEVDVDNDGFVDWVDYGPSAMTDFSSQGDITYGAHDIAVRLTEYEAESGDAIVGDWAVYPISVDTAQNSPPTITNLTFELEGGFGWDHSEALGFFSGTIVDDTRNFGWYEIQVDLNGDEIQEYVSEQGAFGTDAESFAVDVIAENGSNTYAARIVEYDDNSGQMLVGNWTSLTFTVNPPLNDTPEIDFVEFVFNDNGMGELDGEFFGEAIDDLLFGSSFDVEIDWDGDLETAEFAATTDQPGRFSDFLSAVPVGAPLVARIVEHDAWGRDLASAWVAVDFVAAPRQANRSPKFSKQIYYFPVNSNALVNGQSPGSVAATDLDGDAPQYKLRAIRWQQQGQFRKKVPKIGWDVNLTTGAITITDAVALKEALQKPGNAGFSWWLLNATDRKGGGAGASVYLYDDYTVYVNRIKTHMNDWVTQRNQYVNTVFQRANAALTELKDWHKEALGAYTGTTSAVTNLSWATAAFLPTPWGAAVGTASVIIQIGVNHHSTYEAKGYKAMFAAMGRDMLKVFDQDNAITRATKEKENKAIEKLELQIKRAPSPAHKVSRAKQYWDNLQIRVPLPDFTKAATQKQIVGELLIAIVNKKGWTMSGNIRNTLKYGKYYFTWEPANFFKLDAREVMKKMNENGYYKSRWVADAGAFRKGLP